MTIESLTSHASTLLALTLLIFTLCILFFLRSLSLKSQLNAQTAETKTLQDALTELKQEYAVMSAKSEKVEYLEQSNQALHQSLQEERITLAKVKAQNEAQQSRIEALHESHEEKLANMAASEQRLHIQFENLANKIFEEKQQRYSTQTKQNIEAVLAPFKNDLEGFKRQISEQHIREGQERASLKLKFLA